MVKVKNKKSSKNLADSYAKRRKEKTIKKQPTPFEVHVNRDKTNVLGRKSKSDQGLPGISRAKAIAKRKNTLLLEYKVKDKDNIFLDRRIGEKNYNMSNEDKAMARFAAERVKSHNKKNIFNLNDEEVLTHRGQSLMDIEKYDDPRSDEEDYSDDENNTGKLDKKFVGDAHFGGGVLSKPDSEMSRKDLIDQLIAESKKRKAERQKIREQTIDLTEKLDSEWRDLIPLVTSANKSTSEENQLQEKTQTDDYDRALRELKFEAKGHPTDKLKSEEEIAKEEKINIEKLEKDRLARMQSFSDEINNQKKHKSADELDDFHIERIEDEEDDSNDLRGILSLPDSNCTIEHNEKEEQVVSDTVASNNTDEYEQLDAESHNKNEEGSEEKGDEEGSEEEDDEEGSEESDSGTFGDNQNKDIESGLEDESKDEFEDNLSDLKGSDSSDEDELVNEVQIANKEDNETDEDSKETKEDKSNSEKLLETARRELPYIYAVPENYKELKKLLKGHGPEHQSVIIERVIKCNNLKVLGKNKEKIVNLFTYLVQYLTGLAKASKDVEKTNLFFQILDKLSPYLYDLAHADSVGTANIMRDTLKEKHLLFESQIKKYPGLDTLILFKLVSLLYPTSDFRHSIVTPSIVFISQILLKCKIKGKEDVAKGLFLCALMLEYTALSKRWSPQVINYLRGIMYISLPKPFSQVIRVIPPFKATGETSNILVLEENHKKSDYSSESIKMQTKDLLGPSIDDDFRIRAFGTTVNLLIDLFEQTAELEAVYFIFEPVLTLLTFGSVKRYPKIVKEQIKSLITNLESARNKKLEYLTFEKKKPKALRMYEPLIEVIVDGKQRKSVSKEKAEHEKLVHKLKRETKSAKREIRRDTAFITKIRVKQQIAADEERKRKVREIYGDAATQQHELKKFKKK